MAFLEEVLPALRVGKTIRRPDTTIPEGSITLRIFGGNLLLMHADGTSTRVNLVTRDLLAEDWKVV